MDTVEKLDRLAEIQAQKTLIDIDKEDKRKEIMAPIQAQIDELMKTVQGALSDLDAEYEPKANALSENYEKLEEEIRAEVIASGSTVKGAHMQAVYNKGRVTWDTKQLDGLMIVVPQLAQARKEGDPYVTMKKIG